MEFTTELDRVKKILTVHVTGEYHRPHEGYEVQRYVINTYPDHGCRRVLLDLTQAVVFGGTMPTYRTGNPDPEVLQELRKFSFAAVYAEITDDERFFENVTTNRGLRVRVFDDLEKAIEWLEKERESG